MFHRISDRMESNVKSDRIDANLLSYDAIASPSSEVQLSKHIFRIARAQKMKSETSEPKPSSQMSASTQSQAKVSIGLE